MAATIRPFSRAITVPPALYNLSASYSKFSSKPGTSGEDSHHGHGHGASQRTDKPAKWANSIHTNGPTGLVSKSCITSNPVVGQTQRFVSTGANNSESFANSNRAMQYFMVGSLGVLSASAAKSTVTEFLGTMAASADVLALAKVEVELASIPEGKNAIIKWRGKPVFVRHRTSDEIKEAREADWKTFRDPESDEERTKRPEWLVMVGVCTHLGCVPIGEAGDYGGWFCPCHGSHYDISGRARKGPAPLNLEIPAYDFNDGEGKLVIG